jgi:hypothetical protein
MNVIEVVKRHFDAWNRHDADAIVALFAEGGTYSNPARALPAKPSRASPKGCLRLSRTRPLRSSIVTLHLSEARARQRKGRPVGGLPSATRIVCNSFSPAACYQACGAGPTRLHASTNEIPKNRIVI